jgi:hypothetical protein
MGLGVAAKRVAAMSAELDELQAEPLEMLSTAEQLALAPGLPGSDESLDTRSNALSTPLRSLDLRTAHTADQDDNSRVTGLCRATDYAELTSRSACPGWSTGWVV